MTTAMTIKQYDTLPFLKVKLKDAEGRPVDLTDATVRVAIQPYFQPSRIITRDAHVADGYNGEVWVIWQPDETSVAGISQIEFRVEYPDGNRETYPNDGYLQINILERIGG